jgi:ubiquinone/menaquinone biosynthesis C-methylase UbiE
MGEERAGEEIVGGILASSKFSYPILAGVACLLSTDQQMEAKEGFTAMWRLRKEGKFEGKSLYGITPDRKARWIADSFRRPFLPGEWVLDAGCGSAETTCALARQYPETQFVGLDFSDAVRLSAEGSAELPNLHFVQGDVANLPFPGMGFDHVFSLGVLHHTPDTLTALRGTAAAVKPGGELLVWLYPMAAESAMAAQLYMIRDWYFMGKGHEIPAPWRYQMARLCSLTMMPTMSLAYLMYKGASKLGGRAEDKVLSEDLSLKDLFDTTTFAVFDNITPKYQNRHSKNVVLQWFADLGFSRLRTDGSGTFLGEYAG